MVKQLSSQAQRELYVQKDPIKELKSRGDRNPWNTSSLLEVSRFEYASHFTWEHCL